MTDIADRLNAALDLAEQNARAASPGPWRFTPDGEVESAPLTEGDWMRAKVAGYFGHYEVRTPEGDRAFIAANDPPHVLRTIAAHRDIVEWCRTRLPYAGPVLRSLASIYLPDTDQGEPR